MPKPSLSIVDPVHVIACTVPGSRACYACRHYVPRGAGADCTHPVYRVPTPWLQAIARGQPCGADNAPLWEPRPAPAPARTRP